jgi:hypothetical protein
MQTPASQKADTRRTIIAFASAAFISIAVLALVTIFHVR